MKKSVGKSVVECAQCLYKSSHPFGLRFDEKGVCTGCITHREKTTLDWNARFQELEKLVTKLKKKNKNKYYDCVVPIRGTPEHFYVLDVVKNRLKMNPLVVSYNSQFNSEVGIVNLDRIRETFDVDILIYSTNEVIYKKIIRESLVKFSNMRWPYLAGETTFPVQAAVERNIPLVVWPYHQATEQVGMHSYTESPEMSRRYRAQFDLLGVEPEDFTSSETLIKKKDIFDLQYPSDQDLMRTDLRGIYLANYLPWDSRRYSEEMIEKYHALGAQNFRTFDTYDRIDDKTYMTIHDVLKYYQHGYSRVTDNLCREIRFGRISKKNSKPIERYYQQQFPEIEIRRFLDWLGITPEAFKWYVKYLPLRKAQKFIEPRVNRTMRMFVSSFIQSGFPVQKGENYIIYGKGLNLKNAQ